MSTHLPKRLKTGKKKGAHNYQYWLSKEEIIKLRIGEWCGYKYWIDENGDFQVDGITPEEMYRPNLPDREEIKDKP